MRGGLWNRRSWFESTRANSLNSSGFRSFLYTSNLTFHGGVVRSVVRSTKAERSTHRVEEPRHVGVAWVEPGILHRHFDMLVPQLLLYQVKRHTYPSQVNRSRVME